MKIWILIWRLNPPHIWHMRILDESIKENNKTILFLWSSNVIDNKNPYSYNERKKFIKSMYDNQNLIINALEDLPDDLDWIKLINKKLFWFWYNNSNWITFYGWDLENDYAIIVLKKYIEALEFNKIDFVEITRKNYFIDHRNRKIEISSTLVREAIKNNDKELLKKLLNSKLHSDFL